MMLLICMSLAGLQFEQQDIPAAWNYTPGLVDEVQWKNNLEDMDGDGAPDLIIFVPSEPGHSDVSVAFQRGGAFHKSDMVPFPPLPHNYSFDIWKGTLYVRSPGTLDLYQWKGEWQHVMSQEMEWVSKQGIGRFLLDLDKDGTPEILDIGDKGPVIFVRGDRWYSRVAEWDVYPPAQLIADQAQTLWPSAKREWVYPSTGRQATLWITPQTVEVFRGESVGGGKVKFGTWSFPIDAAFYSLPGEPTYTEHGVVDAAFKPADLNADGIMEFVAYDQIATTASVIPRPRYTVRVSTDGGKSIQQFESTGFRPQTIFADYNNDGNLDLVMGATDVFDGGIRETALRFLTGSQLNHTIQIYLQESGGIFSKSPTLRHTFSLRFTERPWISSPRFAQYRASGLVNLAGDFNDDGYRDAVVSETPTEVAVYYGGPGGIDKEPAHRLPCPEGAYPEVADFDGDGRPDICMQLFERITHRAELGTLHLLRESAS